MQSNIKKSVENRIGVLTLNRPGTRNALDDVLISELLEGINAFSRNADIRVIILTGEGAAFCAGMNLDYLQRSMAKSADENIEDAKALQKLLLAVRQSRKTVIAMVNGPAMGGGCGLAAACDFVFASQESARFGVPEVRMGFVPAVILEFLVHRIGIGKTREFVLQGAIVDSTTAKSLGLVTETVSHDSLTTRVMEFANQLCSQTSASSSGLTKELLTRFDEMNRKDAQDFAANLNALIRKTDDFRRGIEAAINKEKIIW